MTVVTDDNLDAELKADGFPVIGSIAQVSEATGFHEMTVWKAIQRRDLKATKVARRWKIRRSDLASWLEGK
jgi:excisionase family DNA binding protein